MTIDTARLGLQQILDALRRDATLFEEHAEVLNPLTPEGRTFEALAKQARRTIVQLVAVLDQLDAR